MNLRASGVAVVVIPALLADGGTIRYVDINNANPTTPYISWGTAAADIQTAIDASDPGDQILVMDGVYNTGGRAVYGTATNRVVVDRPVTVQSVNGPSATFIEGYKMAI